MRCIPLTAALFSFFLFSQTHAQSCCTGTRGNVDLSPDDQIDIADLTLLIDHMFISLADLPCPAEANLDASPGETLDIVDLQILIDFLFISFTPPPACPGGALTYEQREIAMNAVSSLYDSLQGSDLLAIAQQLLTRIQSRPEFEASGISDSTSVWARFTDGRLYIIPNNRPPDLGEFGLEPAPNPEAESIPHPDFEPGTLLKRKTPPVTTATTFLEMPGSMQVRLVNAMGGCYFNINPYLKQMFEAANYMVTQSNATIAELKTVSGDGFFYMQAHGGSGELRDTNTQGEPITTYALWTSELVTAAKDSLYAAMLNNGELAVMEAQGSGPSGCTTVRHYAITPRFINEYMSFASNSVAYINACGSYKSEMSAMFGLNGVSRYLGWTKSVSGKFVALSVAHFVDRMLGTNKTFNFGSGVGIQAEDPPQRAFPIGPVMADLARLQYDTEPQTGAKLQVDNVGGSFGILAPSIMFCTVEESSEDSRLIINGTFGSRPPDNDGIVTINDQPLDIQIWHPDLISCDLPTSGANSVGTVKVGVRRSDELPPLVFVESNEVNISEWYGQFEYLKTEPALTSEMVFTARLRADVHDFREYPHQTPIKSKIILAEGRNTTGIANFEGNASGSTGECTMTFSVSATVEMDNPYEFDGLGAHSIWGAADMQQGELELNIFAGAGYDNGLVTVTGPIECNPGTYTAAGGTTTEECLFDDLSGAVKTLYIPLDDNLNALGGSRSCVTGVSFALPEQTDLEAEVTLRWSNLTLIYAPNPQHAR